MHMGLSLFFLLANTQLTTVSFAQIPQLCGNTGQNMTSLVQREHSLPIQRALY